MPKMILQLTNRLHSIEFYSEHLKNMELIHCLYVFESYIYGVVSQHERILEGQKRLFDPQSHTSGYSYSIQIRLDVYYYILSWDKLKKIFNKLKKLIDPIMSSMSSDNVQEFRVLRKKIDNFLGALHTDARNEYEHPSLKWVKRGNNIEWGFLSQDERGNITLHVGGEEYASIQKEHVDKLKSLWIELIDFLLNHFSNKPSTSSLLQVKQYFEDNIDHIIEEYDQYRNNNKDEEANHIVKQVLSAESYLSREGIPLNKNITKKINSAIWRKRSG